MRKLIISIFISVCFVSSTRAVSSAYAIQNVNVGDQALGFNLDNLEGGSVVLGDYFGKNVAAVCFWNLTAKDSVKELDALAQLYSWYHQENNLEVFGIFTPPEPRDINETELAEINELLEEKKYPFPILLDHKQTVYKLYGVISFPSFLVINKKGEVDYLMPMWSPLKGEDDVKNSVKKALGIEIAKEREARQKVSEPDTESGDTHYELGVVYRKNGQMDEAKEEFKKTIELFSGAGKGLFAGMKKKREVHPNLANAYNDLGEILLEEGKKEEALTSLKKAGDEYREIIKKLQKSSKGL
ncbi:MAG: redoxin domain-containing protein [bacterium]